MPMGMIISDLSQVMGEVYSHIGVGFLLFVLLGGQCEGLELQISNSRSALFLCAYMSLKGGTY